MLVELTEQQVKQLLGFLSEANIKGGQAPIVLELAKVLQTPAVVEGTPEMQAAVDKGCEATPDDIKDKVDTIVNN